MSHPIASTILAQLGGNRFLAMTGAKDLASTENALIMRLPRGALGGINSVVVRLDASDTYTVMFNKRTQMGAAIRCIASHSGVYADQLRALFTAETGLYTSL
jgi:hypothetical protein